LSKALTISSRELKWTLHGALAGRPLMAISSILRHNHRP
jgi:hypothetical protein